MAVTFRAAGSLAGNATTNSQSITAPACQADDILICALINKNVTANAFSPPDGTWTQVISTEVNDCTTSADDHQFGLYWKRAGAGDSGASFTFTKATDDNSLFAGVIVAYAGAVTSGSPLDATSPARTKTAGAADNVSFPAFDPTSTDVRAIFVAFYGNDATTFAAAMSGDTNPDCTIDTDQETSTGSDASIAFCSGVNDGSNIAARTWASSSTVDAGNTGVVFALVAKTSTEPFELTTWAYQNATTSTYTFVEQNLGTPASDRKIIVAVTTRQGSNASATISVSVGGVSASQEVFQEKLGAGSASERAGIYIASVPSGVVGDVVVTTSVNQVRCIIAVYRTTKVTSDTPYHTGTSVASDPTCALNIPAEGVAIGAASTPNNATATWTGLTEDFEAYIGSASTHTAASGYFTSAESGRTILCDFSTVGTEPCGAFASWSMAPAETSVELAGVSVTANATGPASAANASTALSTKLVTVGTGTITPAVVTSVALTTQAVTANKGLLATTLASALTTKLVTANAQTLTPSISYSPALTTQAVSVAAGTITAATVTSVALTGAAVSVATTGPLSGVNYSPALATKLVTTGVGTLAPSINYSTALTTKAVSVAVGTLAAGTVTSVALTGTAVSVAATGPTSSISSALTTKLATAGVGSLTPSISYSVALTTKAVSTATGTITPLIGVSAVLTGTAVSVATTAPSVSAGNSTALSSAAVTVGSGTITPVAGLVVGLTGVTVSAVANTLASKVDGSFVLAGKAVAVATQALSSSANASTALTTKLVTVGLGVISPQAGGSATWALLGTGAVASAGLLTSSSGVSLVLPSTVVTANKGLFTTTLAVPLVTKLVTVGAGLLGKSFAFTLTGNSATVATGTLGTQAGVSVQTALAGCGVAVGSGVISPQAAGNVQYQIAGVSVAASKGLLATGVAIPLVGTSAAVNAGLFTTAANSSITLGGYSVAILNGSLSSEAGFSATAQLIGTSVAVNAGRLTVRDFGKKRRDLLFVNVREADLVA